MPRLPACLAALLTALLLANVAWAGDALAAAGQAQRLLGPHGWSRVVRVESRASAGVESRHVLVFELEGRLWHYEPGVGTQSLPLRGGGLEATKADLGPSLRALHPSSSSHALVEHGTVARSGRRGKLPAGCFVESVAQWQRLRSGRRPPENARLLAFYVPLEVGKFGHTVLYYEHDGRRYVFDPERPTDAVRLPDGRDFAPLAAALHVVPRGLRRDGMCAKFLALDGSGRAHEPVATTGGDACPNWL